MPRDYDKARLEQLSLYVASRSTDDPRFGKTKLAKILFYSDFMAYTEIGDSITGAEYSKLPNGPFPWALNSAIKRMSKSGVGAVAVTDYHGRDQERLVALTHPDISGFSSEEISLVDQVIDALRLEDAAGVSELSHREAAWKCVDDMDAIPYELAWVAAGPSQESLRIGLEVAKELGLAE